MPTSLRNIARLAALLICLVNASGNPGYTSTPTTPLAVTPTARVTASADGALFAMGTVRLLDTPTLAASFTLRNGTDQPVTINALIPSCGCTVATLGASGGELPYTVASQGSISVNVALDPSEAGVGDMTKSVLVQTSAGDMNLDITANLVGPAQFERDAVDLGNVALGQKRSVVVAVDIDDRAESVPVNLTTVDQSVTVHALGDEPLAGGFHRRTFIVTLANIPQIGVLDSSLYLQPSQETIPSGQPYPPISIPLTVNVVAPVTAVPTEAQFGVVKAGKSATLTVALTGDLLRRGAPKVTSKGQWLAATVSKHSDPEASPAYEITFTVAKTTPVGEFATRVVVTLPNGLRFAIPVVATVSKYGE